MMKRGTRLTRFEGCLPNEVWKSVVGFPDYEVSSLGRVVSHRPKFCFSGVVLRQFIDVGGYSRVTLTGDLGTRNCLVHRLVCEAFLGVNPEGREVAHIDGNPSNNAASNLYWATPAQNISDRQRHGGYRKLGEKFRKLTDQQIEEVSFLHLDGVSISALSKRFDVSRPSIKRYLARA